VAPNFPVFAEMDMSRERLGRRITPLLALVVALAGCQSRQDAMQREIGQQEEKKKKEIESAEVPPHPLRDKLEPVLSKIYQLNEVPGVVDADIPGDGTYNYELTPGVAAVVRLAGGLSQEQKVRAIVMGVAEADAWAFRPDARRDYADLIHRVKRGFGDDQKELILKAYANLRLLQFFNSAEAQAAIAALPDDIKPTVAAMQREYTEGKERMWDEWMGVKMYARRVVAGDEPFRGVLRDLKKELGKEEPPPLTWEASMDDSFLAWAKQVRDDEDLLTKLTNLRELREREEFLNDTHSLWVMEGSPKVPAKAKNVKIDKDLGFGAVREDLGGGHNEMTYVFSRKLGGSELKLAFVRSIIYGSLLHDFQMLATAGSDFAKRDEDNVIDSRTAVVPDEYDPLYAKCGSKAAADTLAYHFKSTHPFLSDLHGNGDSDAVLAKAHNCVIEGARGDIHIPRKDDEKDVEGPAPGSRLALYQMLARYENVDVNLAKMASEERTEEDDVIDDAEAILKRIKEKENEGKGIK
jgi:hypothetical protein